MTTSHRSGVHNKIMNGTRQRRAKIDRAIGDALSFGVPEPDNSELTNGNETFSVDLPITHCDSHEVGPLIGRDGAICPFCFDVLKNKATLTVHMKKCEPRHKPANATMEEQVIKPEFFTPNNAPYSMDGQSPLMPTNSHMSTNYFPPGTPHKQNTSRLRKQFHPYQNKSNRPDRSTPVPRALNPEPRRDYQVLNPELPGNSWEHPGTVMQSEYSGGVMIKQPNVPVNSQNVSMTEYPRHISDTYSHQNVHIEH